MFWFVFCTIEVEEWHYYEPLADFENFIDEYGFEEKTVQESVIASMYFIFTTLSTVGFGDFHPKGNLERVLGAFVLLMGVAIFSYIMGNFLEILFFF